MPLMGCPVLGNPCDTGRVWTPGNYELRQLLLQGKSFQQQQKIHFILMYLFCSSEMYSCCSSDCSVVLWRKLVWWPQQWFGGLSSGWALGFGLWQGELSRNCHDTVNNDTETKLATANTYCGQWQVLGAQGIADLGCNGWQEKSTTPLQRILSCHPRNIVFVLGMRW